MKINEKGERRKKKIKTHKKGKRLFTMSALILMELIVDLELFSVGTH